MKVFIGSMYLFGRARDISAGGIRIVSRIAPPFRRVVNIAVELPDHRWAAVEGELVHAVPTPENDGWSWSVRFSRLPLGHRLRVYLADPTERAPDPSERVPVVAAPMPAPTPDPAPASAKRYVSDNQALAALYHETMVAIRARLEAVPARHRRR